MWTSICIAALFRDFYALIRITKNVVNTRYIYESPIYILINFKGMNRFSQLKTKLASEAISIMKTVFG